MPSKNADPFAIVEEDNAVLALVVAIRWFKGLVRSFDPAGADETRNEGLTTSFAVGVAYVIVYTPACPFRPTTAAAEVAAGVMVEVDTDL
jgi:hypothetical protein